VEGSARNFTRLSVINADDSGNLGPMHVAFPPTGLQYTAPGVFYIIILKNSPGFWTGEAKMTASPRLY
jgi:hypothetical protein